MTERLHINPKTDTHGAFIELLDEDDDAVALVPVRTEYSAAYVDGVRDYVAIEWAEDICFAVNQYVRANEWNESTKRPYSGFHNEPAPPKRRVEHADDLVVYATEVLEAAETGAGEIVDAECAKRISEAFMAANPVHVDSVQAMIDRYGLEQACHMVFDRAEVPQDKQEELFCFVRDHEPEDEDVTGPGSLGLRTVIVTEPNDPSWELVTYSETECMRVENLREGRRSEWLAPSVCDDIIKDPVVITTVDLEFDLDLSEEEDDE